MVPLVSQTGGWVGSPGHPSLCLGLDLATLGAALIYPELSSRESDCPHFIGRSIMRTRCNGPQLTDQSNAMSHAICPNLG